MTSYFSFIFLAAFLPVVVVLYAVTPRRARWAVLLAASYVFFFWLSRELILALVVSTLSIYLAGLGLGALIERRQAAVKAAKSGKREIRAAYARKMKLVMAAGLLVNFGLLAAFKYLHFFASVIDGALGVFGIVLNTELPVWAAPIGISFYTLMAGSYLIDVYRGTVQADRNLGRVALFLGFFPQIMEGPICRYGQTADQLMAGAPVTRANLYAGTLRMLWGLGKKMIVADRLNAFVKPVFSDYTAYDGGIIALGAVLYTVQLYCDFSGTMDVALGMGRIFGVSLPENFRQPFFSRTAAGFWQRWHITLGTWLRDYIYYPVSLSKPLKKLTSKARKRFGNRYGPLLASSAALFCVWFGNGLWHGAGSQYIFFGLYYFVLIVAGSLIEPTAVRLAERAGISRDSAGYRAFQIARTLVVIVVGELFFRAEGLDAGLAMFGAMVCDFNPASLVDGSVFGVGVSGIGLDGHDLAIVLAFVVLMLVVGLIRERDVSITERVAAWPLPARWALWYALFFAVIIFGAYGTAYAPVDPMYAQF